MLHIILHRNLYFEYIFYEVIFLDNFNIDKNTMDKLNSMLNNGNLNDMLSQIPPETIKNFSNMMNGNMYLLKKDSHIVLKVFQKFQTQNQVISQKLMI